MANEIILPTVLTECLGPALQPGQNGRMNWRQEKKKNAADIEIFLVFPSLTPALNVLGRAYEALRLNVGLLGQLVLSYCVWLDVFVFSGFRVFFLLLDAD